MEPTLRPTWRTGQETGARQRFNRAWFSKLLLDKDAITGAVMPASWEPITKGYARRAAEVLGGGPVKLIPWSSPKTNMESENRGLVFVGHGSRIETLVEVNGFEPPPRRGCWTGGRRRRGR